MHSMLDVSFPVITHHITCPIKDIKQFYSTSGTSFCSLRVLAIWHFSIINEYVHSISGLMSALLTRCPTCSIMNIETIFLMLNLNTIYRPLDSLVIHHVYWISDAFSHVHLLLDIFSTTQLFHRVSWIHYATQIWLSDFFTSIRIWLSDRWAVQSISIGKFEMFTALHSALFDVVNFQNIAVP